jgi:transposase
MTTITTIGLDLAKKVFQVHGVDAEDKVVVARKLRRKEVLTFFAKLALVASAPDRNRHHAKSALDAGAPSTHDPERKEM